MYNMPMVSREILGVRVDFGMSMNDVLDVIENKFLKDGKNHYICTTNPEFVMDAQKDPQFKKIINESDLSVPDGAGVIYARNYLEGIKNIKRDFLFPIKVFFYGIYTGVLSSLRKDRVVESKITGVDLTYKICEISSKKNYNVFFLGGKAKDTLGKHINQNDKDMANESALQMKKTYPSLKVIGATSKYNREEKDDSETIDYIKKCMSEKGVDHLDFLLVAYGHGYQEKWIVRNSYKIPAKVSIGLGGTFDYIVGQVKLPPEMYVKRNLGWIYRLIKQPWRIKRIIKAFPHFPLKIFITSLSK